MTLLVKLIHFYFCTSVLVTKFAVECQDVITEEALGREASLGQLYSEVTEKLSPDSIFIGTFDEHIRTTGIPYTSSKYSTVQSSFDRTVTLGVSVKVYASINLGIASAKGSAHASYLTSDKESTENVEAVYSMETYTVKESLDIITADLLEHFNAEALKGTEDTHIVVGLSYGSQVNIKITKARKATKVKKSYKAGYEYEVSTIFTGSIKGGSETSDSSTKETATEKVQLQIFGDAIIEEKYYPTNVEQVIEFIRAFPSIVHKQNKGKGKIIKLHLMPIARFLEVVMDSGLANITGRTIPRMDLPGPLVSYTPNLAGIVDALDHIDKVVRKLNELSHTLYGYRFIFNNTVLLRVNKLEVELLGAISNVKGRLKDEIINGRQENMGRTARLQQRKDEMTSRMNRLLNDSVAELDVFEDMIDNDYKDELLKVALVRWLIYLGAAWVGRADSVEPYIFRHLNTDLTVCTFHWYPRYLFQPEGVIRAMIRAFQNSGYKPVVVDCDFLHETCDHMTSQEMLCAPVYMRRRTPPKLPARLLNETETTGKPKRKKTKKKARMKRKPKTEDEQPREGPKSWRI